jgi:peptidoglycan/xylan/chitin deacetylase (PgdA/CDA1 family)
MVTGAQYRAMGDFLAGRPCDEAAFSSLTGLSVAEAKAAVGAADPVIAPIPEKAVILTFDDSTVDHYNIVCPTLERYGAHAVLCSTEMEHDFFSGANFSDKSIYMTWEQIKELSDRGHEIANHSWHHAERFDDKPDDYVREEMHGLEERCAQFGIPKPITFACPMTGATKRVAGLMQEMGYLWGRGGFEDGTVFPRGSVYYDPYADSPFGVPGYMDMTTEGTLAAIDRIPQGQVMLLVFHQVTGGMPGPDFETVVRHIYEVGGQCLTFRELSNYVDPVKAAAYFAEA